MESGCASDSLLSVHRPILKQWRKLTFEKHTYDAAPSNWRQALTNIICAHMEDGFFRHFPKKKHDQAALASNRRSRTRKVLSCPLLQHPSVAHNTVEHHMYFWVTRDVHYLTLPRNCWCFVQDVFIFLKCCASLVSSGTICVNWFQRVAWTESPSLATLDVESSQNKDVMSIRDNYVNTKY